VILENQKRGNYRVHLDLAYNGADTTLHINMGYTKDPVVGKLLATADFRRALSLGIDRDQMNETFWLGLGTPGSTAPAEVMPESPGPEWRKKWSVLDIKQANAMLDKLGLTKKDSAGYRVRPDNGERLVIQLLAVKAFMDWPKHAEMISQHWRKIGIFGDVKESERGLAFQRMASGDHHILVWTNGGTELLYLYPSWALPTNVTPGAYGIETARWYASNGTQGTKPADPHMLKALEMFRAGAGMEQEARDKNAQEIWKIMVDQQFHIGTVGQSPALMGVRIASNRLGNIPDRACIAQHCRTPGSSHPETWFYKS
jgi:peptide/nickel transport system substrate-binding protein